MHAECKYFDLILGKRTAVKKVIKPAVAIAEWKHVQSRASIKKWIKNKYSS